MVPQMLATAVGALLLSASACLTGEFLQWPPPVYSSHLAGHVWLWVVPAVPLYWGLWYAGAGPNASLAAAYALTLCGGCWSWWRSL